MKASRQIVLLLAAPLLLAIPGAWAVDIYSASVDWDNHKITLKGSDLDSVTEFTLGGVPVGTANVMAAELDMPFNAEVASAVQWRGSYRLAADNTVFISVYFSDQVVYDGEPPPPSGGSSCPCIAGWNASTIPTDNWTWCVPYVDGTQESLSGQRDLWFISIALDPYNLYFDPVNPENSRSYCVLHDGVDWVVAEPLVNRDQFDDCEDWMWVNICL